jgi:hypothetical protein
MNALRSWGLKVAVLLVAMLAAIGSWEIYKGTTKNVQAQLPDIHYKCYDFRVVEQSPPVRGIRVQTQNQFGTEVLVINKAKLLCLPTLKTRIP